MPQSATQYRPHQKIRYKYEFSTASEYKRSEREYTVDRWTVVFEMKITLQVGAFRFGHEGNVFYMEPGHPF
jgi:hypothetical protein